MAKYIKSDGSKQEPIKVSPGKLFELLIPRLEQATRDSGQFTIHPNEGIQNLEGYSRQFDVIVKSNSEDYPQEIAIECKEHGRPIDVAKIECFECKCGRVPTITKKIFVSNSGYTKGAKKAAKVYGIDLLNIESIDGTELRQLINPLNLKLQKRYIRILNVIGLRSDSDNNHFRDFDQTYIEFEDYGKPVSLREFCTSFIINLTQKQWNSHFDSVEDRIKPTPCNYRIKPIVKMTIKKADFEKTFDDLMINTQIYEEIVQVNQTKTKEYKDVASGERKVALVQLEGKDKTGTIAQGEAIISNEKKLVTVNFSLIEDKQIVCSSSNTFRLDRIVIE